MARCISAHWPQNGTVSTALARPQDWKEMVEICFDNREADVGRFLRRQLGGQEIGTLKNVLNELGFGQSSPPGPTLRQRAEALLQDGEARFAKALASRKFTGEERVLIDAGAWEVALVIDPPHTDQLPDQIFRATISSSNPSYTGWPVWLDSTRFTDEKSRPKVVDKAQEALIASAQGWSKHLDFMRLDPKGEFFLRRNLSDDVTDKIKPASLLDPIIIIIRITEAILVGLAFAKALGWDNETTRLGFAFRWTKLKGRRLEPWANPQVTISAFGSAHDDEVTTFIDLALDTPPSAIAPYVDQAVRELFVQFDGYIFPSTSVEQWVTRLITRTLNS
jgi:hypothetical protein